MSRLCRWFGHSVRATHTNRWQVATRECCTRCQLSRSLERDDKAGKFYWQYSDGRKSDTFGIFDEGLVNFGETKVRAIV